MKTALRRILGILVMIAGILGLLLSLAGIIAPWLIRPNLTQALDNTIATLSTSIDTSKQAMVVTEQALGATVNSVTCPANHARGHRHFGQRHPAGAGSNH